MKAIAKTVSVFWLILALVPSVGLGIVSLTTGIILGQGFIPAVESLLDSIPWWVWFMLFLNWSVWTARGQSVTVPNFTKKELFIVNTAAVLFCTTAKSFPWAALPLAALYQMTMFGLYTLIEGGYRRYDRIMARKEKHWLASRRLSESASSPVSSQRI